MVHALCSSARGCSQKDGKQLGNTFTEEKIFRMAQTVAPSSTLFCHKYPFFPLWHRDLRVLTFVPLFPPALISLCNGFLTKSHI